MEPHNAGPILHLPPDCREWRARALAVMCFPANTGEAEQQRERRLDIIEFIEVARATGFDSAEFILEL
jgi:hypothetical protein